MSNEATQGLLAMELKANLDETTLAHVALEEFKAHSSLVEKTRELVADGRIDDLKHYIGHEISQDDLPDNLRQRHELPLAKNGDGSGEDHNDEWFDSDVGYCTPDKAHEKFGNLKFVWEDWIPAGSATMIAGEMDIGKSFFSAELIACFTGNRETWPNGEPIDIEPGRVLLVETEQMKGAYYERLEKMGVSNNQWFFGPGEDPLAIPDIEKQHKKIEALARDSGARAVVVDSLSGGHGQKENDAYMRRVLQPLSTIASSLGIPVVIVHHLRKRHKHEDSKVTLDRIRGSSTIPQFCRSVIGLYHKDEDDEGLVTVDCIKHNFRAKPKKLGFGFKNDGKGLFFTTEPKKSDYSAIAEAKDFLRKELSDGKVRSTNVNEDAEMAGISKATLNRAKRQIGAESDKEDGVWYWFLPAEKYDYERIR